MCNAFLVEPLIMFVFSKKATKIDQIFTVDLTLTARSQIVSEDFINFCGLLRKHELYRTENSRLTYCWIHPPSQSTLGEQKWDLLMSDQSVDFQIKIGRPKFYAGEMIMLA
jgi:hypothetical protein